MRYAVVLLILAGCQPTIWYRDNTTQAQFEQDKAQCIYEADLALTPAPSRYSVIGEAVDKSLKADSLVGQCMKARGYTTR